MNDGYLGGVTTKYDTLLKYRLLPLGHLSEGFKIIKKQFRTGRPWKTSLKDSKVMPRKISQNSMTKRNELEEDLLPACISQKRYRRPLNSRTPPKLPLLSKQHSETRLKFIRELNDKSVSFWENVLFCGMKPNLNCGWGKLNNISHQKTPFPLYEVWWYN